MLRFRVRNIGWLRSGLAGSLVLAGLGCSTIEKAPPRSRSARSEAAFRITVPQVMRGTVASQAVLDGYRPVIVRGYGVVVGLDGTGSRDLPPDVRAHMIQEASRNGIGLESSGFGHLSPERFLDSMDTAVVVVEGLVPPGATEGTRFDLRVISHPMTSTTSLEGGRLYTSDLRPMIRRGLPPTGSRQAAAIARARGEVFINPFAEPGAIERDTIQRKSGRILNGGIVTRDIPLKLRMATPSHTGVEILQAVINTRFPQEPGQRDPTARGESDESIEITVPPSFADRTGDFVQLLRHTTIRGSAAESVAMTIRRYVQEHPAHAEAASWRWQALGIRSLAAIRELYDYGEELPRLAALRAGAELNDALVVVHLIDMAEEGSFETRLEAIDLLAKMGINPLIDHTLRELVNDQYVEIRLRAYEGLAKRRDPFIARIPVDGKFVIDIVPSTKPMVYVTQIGQPRLVVFGPDLEITQPLTMSAWSNRFMIKELSEDSLEVYYREPDAARGAISKADPQFTKFIHFLGHSTSVRDPRPGLGLGYGQTVGLVHQIWRQGYLDADFKAEQDRILAAIIRQESESIVGQRPEFADTDTEGFDGLGGDGLERRSPSDLERIELQHRLEDAKPAVPRGSPPPK